MVASVSSPADIINNALRRIGYALRVANLFDGSQAASAALDIYGQTRDDLLRDGDWDFAERNVLATLLRSAPPGGYWGSPWDPYSNPPLPWLYAYEYPSDCLKVRIVKQSGGFLLNMAPLPTNFSDANVINQVSSLSALTVNAAGTGYVPQDYIYPAGGTQVSEAILQVSSTKVVAAAVASAGTGGTPGVQTVTGTTGTGTKFQASVTVDGGGTISAVTSITVAGAYSVNPPTLTAEPVTGAGLSGATLNITMGVNAVSIVKPGVFSGTPPTTLTQGSTSGSGSGVTFNPVTYATTTQPQRMILCNVADAMLTYAGQVTDPTQWPPDFVEALCAALGRRLAPVLVGMNAVQLLAQDEGVQKHLAMQEQG